MQSSIDDLKERIRSKIPQLTQNQKRIANYFLDNPQIFALQSVRDLEKQLNTSKATIVRLTQALGYKGFQELKMAFISSMKKELDPIDRYRSSLNGTDNNTNPLTTIIQQTKTNLDKTMLQIDEKDFKRMVKLVENAHAVYCMGLGISFYLAEITAYLLKRISINAYQLPFGALNFSEQIINFSKNDLIIAYSFPPYSLETIKAAEYAKEKKMHVISITDKPTTEIIRYSDIFFQVSVESRTMSNSLVAPLAFVYAVTTRIGQDLKPKIIDTIESIDHVRKEH